MITFGALWVVAFLIARYPQREKPKIDNTSKGCCLILAIFVSGLSAGAIFLLGFYILNQFLYGFICTDNLMNLDSTYYFLNKYNSNFSKYRLAIYFGPLIPVAADFVGSAIFSVWISTIPDMDYLQEWSARMFAWLFMLGGSWSIFSLIAITPYWSNIILFSDSNIFPFILVMISGISVVIYGKSSNTPAAPQTNGSKKSNLWKSCALLSGGIFLFMFMLNLSAALDRVVFPDLKLNKIISEFPSISQQLKIEDIIPDFLIQIIHEFLVPVTPVVSILLLLFFSFVILTVFTYGFSCFVNINSFSLHRYYRNRLIRSFLGSVNPNRNPDLFTNFDQKDNINMSNLTEKSPLLIINAALNLLYDDNLLWQERKSSSFSISRLFCGNDVVGYRPSKAPEETSLKCKEREGSISCNESEEIKNNNMFGYGKDISLGTAMAISGAAVSPNMGYNSSPFITFVMTLFNARLGWWLGNPKYDSWREIGPRNAIFYYICELFGLTNDHCDYVYLSDGGHFENLGAYEMIRRCCRTIVIVDAGCDPDSKFEDLGKLIRLARIDFNAEITFNREFELTDGEIRHFTPMHAGDNQCPPYCLVGEIEYRDINSRGKIIYIKPGVHGDEPLDVCSYHVQNPVFPHESTSDQFFSESQFESYRKLGLHIGSKVFKAIAI